MTGLASNRIDFSLVSENEMQRMSEIEVHSVVFVWFVHDAALQVVNRELYLHPTRNPVPFGPLDPRLVQRRILAAWGS
jgi:hypothetical protein